ncbi:MAG TPA: hypothetical protein VGM93_11420 [Acidimicrobiales bacterium]
MTHPAIDDAAVARLGGQPDAFTASAQPDPEPTHDPKATTLGPRLKAFARKAADPVATRLREQAGASLRPEVDALRAEVAELRRELAESRAALEAELAVTQAELAAQRSRI